MHACLFLTPISNSPHTLSCTEGMMLNITPVIWDQDIPGYTYSWYLIMQARNDRKRGRALQSGRLLTPGLLTERMSRGSSRVDRARDDTNCMIIELDGEQLNHIPTPVHPKLAAATYLNLAHNSFVEVPALGELKSLQSLNLSHNSITQVSNLRSCPLLCLLARLPAL